MIVATSRADTWPGILLDGFGGALIGAVATIVVVVATIKHERRAREDDRLHDVISRAHASTQAYGFATHTASDLASPAAFAVFNTMLQSLVTALTVAQAYEPKLAALLQKTSLELSAVTSNFDGSQHSRDNLRQRVLELQILLGRWLAAPDKIRDGSIDHAKIQDLARSPDPVDHGPQDAALARPRWWQRSTSGR